MKLAVRQPWLHGWVGLCWFGAALLLLLTIADVVGAETPSGGPYWRERFDHDPLGWVDPSRHKERELARVYTRRKEGELTFLHALHDAAGRDAPPAMHYGRAFQTRPAPLEKVTRLEWRWRVVRHPSITADSWQDLAASVYVVMRPPSLIVPGKGFKFGWLAKPGLKDTRQRGLYQRSLRTDPAGPEWRRESVDLCALYRQSYGPCEGQHVLYVGVVTDADGTHSVAEADYADFVLLTVP